jgi:hypothetical protein
MVSQRMVGMGGGWPLAVLEQAVGWGNWKWAQSLSSDGATK